MIMVKQSTAITLTIGPFLDDADGKTAETALGLVQADVRLLKQGGSWAQKGEATSPAHQENGWYSCLLNTTDTGTQGFLILNVSKTGALPVFMEMMVMTAHAWDTLFGSDYLQVDVIQLDSAGLSTHASGMIPSDVRDIAGAAVSTTTAQLGVNAVQVGAATVASGSIPNVAAGSNGGLPTADANNAVRIQTGTGTGQLDFTSGVVKANLVQILAAAITGTAAQLVAAFTKFFNVATPTGTINSLPDAVPDASGGLPVTGNRLTAIPTIANVTLVATTTNLTNAPGAGDLTSTMKTSVETAVQNQLNTAIGGSPTAGSINERVKAVDDKLPSKTYLTGTANSDGDIQMDEATGNYSGTVATVTTLTNAATVSGDLSATMKTSVETAVFNQLNTAFTDATSLTSNGLLDRLRIYGWLLRNKIEVIDASGNTDIHKDDNTTHGFSVATMLTDTAGTTIRLRAE